MGRSSSKFRKLVRNGEEEAAVQLLMSNAELHKALDPSAVYKGNHDGDTPLHCVCRQSMKSLIRIFLTELNGDPNKTNGHDETCLHVLCSAQSSLTADELDTRLLCVDLLLQWSRPPDQTTGSEQKLDLTTVDEKGNTALHYAAAGGMKPVVERLVEHGIPLETENKEKETACDCAEKNGHNDIALFLESKMVFSSDDDQTADPIDISLNQLELSEAYCGLGAQDLQEAKDQLLVETSDMLRVPLFTAEALLRNHEWSREMLLESWIQDPVACCNKCGVTSPKIGLSSVRCNTVKLNNSAVVGKSPSSSAVCGICVLPITDEPIMMSCDHQFCKACWEQYLTGKIVEGDAHNITCPGYDCDKLVPVELIETVVSRDMARRYLQFDIKAFVDTNPLIKWCPYPGCGRAVRLSANTESSSSQQFTLPMTSTSGLGGAGARNSQQRMNLSRSVDCGSEHTFCWECLGEAHEPASCENWQSWHQKIAEVKPEQLSGTEEALENSANCLWLVTNSKPCSSCKSPIQKNEGCNHMKCSKCKYDFCWVCLEPWKKHSSATGGYFRCNRYEVVRKVEEQKHLLRTEAELKNKQVQEMNRFMHYYSRFKNHENSYKLELPLYDTAMQKMRSLARAVLSSEDLVEEHIEFIQQSVTQLLKARHVLKCSYVYGYYLEQTGYKKPIFEFMQTESEECTETLSQMISRPYLRTPRSKIIQAARDVSGKRHEFLSAVAKGLIPADCSPSLKKKSKIFTVEVDDVTRKVMLTSLHKDPHTTWVKGPSGKHTNVSALLDWPDDDSDDNSDSEPLSSPPNSIATTTSDSLHSDAAAGGQSRSDNADGAPPSIANDDSSSTGTSVSQCKRSGCHRLRVFSPRTGQLQEYCSIKCKNLDIRPGSSDQEPGGYVTSSSQDYQMELLRAVEMSRLQFLAETSRALAFGLPEGCSVSSMAANQFPPDVTTSVDSQPRSSVVENSPAVTSSVAGSSGRGTGSNSAAVTSSVAGSSGRGTGSNVRRSSGRGTGSNVRRSSGRGTGSNVNAWLNRQPDEQLRHAVEMSQLLTTKEEEELRKALELSLQDIGKFESSVSNNLCPSTAAAAEAHDDDANDADEAAVNQYISFTSTADDDDVLSSNAFGIIKDVRVNNIVASDTDKISEFDAKNFKELLSHTDAAGCVTLLAAGTSES